LLRAFRARLFDLQTELEKEKSRFVEEAIGALLTPNMYAMFVAERKMVLRCGSKKTDNYKRNWIGPRKWPTD
jgi:hypothetical protein